jgi:hypothetical protein
MLGMGPMGLMGLPMGYYGGFGGPPVGYGGGIPPYGNGYGFGYGGRGGRRGNSNRGGMSNPMSMGHMGLMGPMGVGPMGLMGPMGGMGLDLMGSLSPAMGPMGLPLDPIGFESLDSMVGIMGDMPMGGDAGLYASGAILETGLPLASPIPGIVAEEFFGRNNIGTFRGGIQPLNKGAVSVDRGYRVY